MDYKYLSEPLYKSESEFKELQKGEVFSLETLSFEESPPSMVVPTKGSLSFELSKKGQKQLNKVIHKNEKRIKKAEKIISKAIKYLPKGTEIIVNTENSDLKAEWVTDEDIKLISTEFRIKKGE